ncbi:hypothetical protein PORCRE_410 [Porphyromonas crevioricanis JCM 15906]|uniref:Uncharacterized protein n=1 Tax=Porphyromonas crevioricanis JCM 15906 TaxID=1305617 RepID=S4NBE1_9PORP|nr:hypothetical protein PORCRE_410 [Porphyromonas crevioricanis JCM 15906]
MLFLSPWKGNDLITYRRNNPVVYRGNKLITHGGNNPIVYRSNELTTRRKNNPIVCRVTLEFGTIISDQYTSLSHFLFIHSLL